MRKTVELKLRKANLPLGFDERLNDVLRPAADGHDHGVVLRFAEVAEVLESLQNGLASLESRHALFERKT